MIGQIVNDTPQSTPYTLRPVYIWLSICCNVCFTYFIESIQKQMCTCSHQLCHSINCKRTFRIKAHQVCWPASTQQVWVSEIDSEFICVVLCREVMSLLSDTLIIFVT